jgi:predicted esterase YcpF (UPF0227 family)
MKKQLKKCVYYHGLGGEPSQAMAYFLEQFGYEMICEHIHFELEWMKDRGKSLMERQLKVVEGVDLIMGNSFGAHPAYLMAKATGIDLILVNPAVNRKRSQTGIGSYTMPKGQGGKKPRIESFFGELDDYVPKEYAIEFFKQTGDEFTGYIIKGMDHGTEFNHWCTIFQNSEIMAAPQPIEKLELA